MGFLENKAQYKIWVFAPFFESDDADMQFYYDYTQSIAEYTKVFTELSCNWEWIDITMNNFKLVIDNLSQEPEKNIIINLCDGDELAGVPGISVVHALEKSNLVYTGADAFFYHITTSKINMKRAFDAQAVSNAKWLPVDSNISETAFNEIGSPVIIKPAVSAGSMGIGVKNVVPNFSQYQIALQEIAHGNQLGNLGTTDLLVEKFITGREFTLFIVGSYIRPTQLKCYAPVERVFHPSLPEQEKFLSFDRLWETYAEESAMPASDFFYEYAAVLDIELSKSLEAISIAAYSAVKGMGYGRVDIRMDAITGALYVLEVNAQCGISEDENYTSIGAILKFSNQSFTNLIVEILDDAIARKKIA